MCHVYTHTTQIISQTRNFQVVFFQGRLQTVKNGFFSSSQISAKRRAKTDTARRRSTGKTKRKWYPGG
jgi:hypothetical protein